MPTIIVKSWFLNGWGAAGPAPPVAPTVQASFGRGKPEFVLWPDEENLLVVLIRMLRRKRNG